MTITRTFSHFIVKWPIGTHDITMHLSLGLVERFATTHGISHLGYRSIIEKLIEENK